MKAAAKLFRVKFATTNPFPYHADAVVLAWKAYAESRPHREDDEPEQDALLIKMKKNHSFARQTERVVSLVVKL